MRRLTLPIVMLLAWSLGGCATGSAPLSLQSSAPSEAAQHNAEGMEHYKMGHYDVAKQHFEAALKADPKSAEAAFNLSLALDKLGDHKKATGYFKLAGELAPNNPAIIQSMEYQAHMNAPKPTATGYSPGLGTGGSGARMGY